MAEATTTSFEATQSKDARGENFPVGSFLLPKRLRPHVAVFYAFARAADDIGDSPDLPAEEKIRRLDAFEDVLLGRREPEPGLEKPWRIRQSLIQCGVTTDHCRDLLHAFKRDATYLRYKDWNDLRFGYCRLSASPVGRYLLDLHGEDRAGWPASDALCDALQVLNHLQDCQKDYRQLNRVYLPQDWMKANGVTVEDLDRPALVPGMRKVLDLCLDATAELMVEARRLPGLLKSKHLAMESAVIVRIADKLTGELRRRDPIAARVELSKPQFLACAVRGIASVWF
ncbi:MAG: squalene synthase HpnC [Alphaproteobacteria bacterium]|nr:squalene synthase HpnC [Alphaproteobacteria bacterium]